MKLRIFTYSNEDMKALFASTVEMELSASTEYYKDDHIIYVESDDKEKLKEFVEKHLAIIFGEHELYLTYKDLEVQ